jgi:hypothetical protein
MIGAELDWGQHPEGGVGTVLVVLGAPVGDEDLGLQQGVELLDGQQLVARA